MAQTLLISWGSQLVVALLYGVVGLRLAKRNVAGEARLAHQAFLVFWFALMGSSLLGAVQMGLYIVGVLTVPVYNMVSQFSLLLVVAALWGILAYLLFLYTGSTRNIVPLTLFYAVFFVAIEALLLYVGSPERLTDDGWAIERLPEADIPEWVGLLFLVFLIGPQLGAAVAFLSLYPKVDDPTQRFRIALVGGAILVWFGSALGVSLLSQAGDGTLQDALAWQVGSRLLGVAAVATMLMAYLPPKWIQARGIRSIADE